MTPGSDRLFPGKLFIDTALEALDTKTAMSRSAFLAYIQRAAMAGIIAALFFLTNFAIIGGVAAIGGQGDLSIFGKMIGGILFGFALVFIYYTRSELLTSNMMVASIGLYYRRTSLRRAGWMLLWCYVGNFLGALLVALIVSGTSLVTPQVAGAMDAAVEVKLGYLESASGMGDLFLRAILCNLMINMAMILVYNGAIRDDFTKSITMVVAVFLFAFMGLEHSVANTALFAMKALHGGIDMAAAWGNIGISIVGNFVGGGVLIGWYYAFANDSRRIGQGGAL